MDAVGIIGIAVIIGAFVYAFLRRAPLSLSIAIAILIIYALLATTSRTWGAVSGSTGYWDLALVHNRSWRPEEAPEFFTSMFVHGNLLHLGFNMAALIFIGAALEDRIGRAPFAFIFIIGGLAGTLMFYLLHYGDLFVLIGASGAIMAELGAYARLYPRDRVTLFIPFLPLPALPVIWVAIGFLILSSFMVYTVPFIAHEAHIGGLIAGLFIAPLAMRLPSTKKMKERTVKTDVLVALATTAELKDILEKIKEENVVDVRHAWVERFVQRAKCPRCGGSLRLNRGRVFSECGWKVSLR